MSKEVKKQGKIKGTIRSAKKTAKVFTMGAVLGALTGALIGLLKAKKPGEEFEKDLKDTITKGKKKIDELWVAIEPRAREIFGQLSTEVQSVYEDVKQGIIDAGSKVKGKMDQKKYNQVVDKVIMEQKRKKTNISKTKLDQLGREFKKNWNDVKKLFK